MQVIETFRALCRIPHCSADASQMKNHLERLAAEYGYRVRSDAAGNLHCAKEGATVTLQAHYDMVCIGKAPQIEVVEEEGWLVAEGSTLGADNGIALAMILELMREGRNFNALFTSDEEIGLHGARGMELPIETPYLLNLDSEEEGIVTIGCAGGVDLVATMRLERREKRGRLYESVIEGEAFIGGHSGVDIDKEIPNAIKALAKELVMTGASLVNIGGGERRNAIPKRATAVVAVEEESVVPLHWRALEEREASVLVASAEIVQALNRFVHGVRSRNEELGIVQNSINLAQVKIEGELLTVQLSARSMDPDELMALEHETREHFQSYGFGVRSEGFYPPWNPQPSALSELLLEAVARISGNAELGAIHAGLECGILKEHAPGTQMASIGPNILYPHSTRERVEIASVERLYETVKAVLDALEA